MSNETHQSRAGNSKSPEMPADNHFTHHHNPHLDVLEETEMEEVEMEEAEVEVEEETAEVDYLPQASSHHMDELLILLTNFWAVNQKHLQGIGRRLNPSSRNGSCTAGSMPTTWRSRTSTKRQCYS
jgi:hypothetical protein